MKSKVAAMQAWFVVFALTLLLTAVGGDEVASAEREQGKVKSKALNEISGMAASRASEGVLWVSNDGDSGRLYAIHTDGKAVGELKLPVRVVDVEEIALGPGAEKGADYLYVGDVGDNDSRRFEVTVVRFKEPAIGEAIESLAIDDVEHIRLAYPDGPHNAEAMFVDPVSRELFLTTKEPGGAALYSVPIDSLKHRVRSELKLVGRLAVENVSGGAISHDGGRVLLRREDRGWLWERRPDEPVGAAMQRTPQAIAVRGRRQGKNGEAITFCPESTCYFTLSEGKKQSISEFDLPPAANSVGGDRR